MDDEQRQQPESPIPTVQEELSVALAEIDFKEDRFVEGLRLLGLPVAKAAKSVADLSDTACRQAFSEGIDGIILAIEGALEKKAAKRKEIRGRRQVLMLRAQCNGIRS